MGLFTGKFKNIWSLISHDFQRQTTVTMDRGYQSPLQGKKKSYCNSISLVCLGKCRYARLQIPAKYRKMIFKKVFFDVC